MIVKSFETSKINLKLHKNILLYGKNEGAKNEEIEKLIKKLSHQNISRYEEKEVLNDSELFLTNLFSKSLFEKEKFIIINRVTDKILKIIEEIIDKSVLDINIALNAENLEKKSKLRSLFEKNKNLICVPFYPDTPENLSKIVMNFFKTKNISLSQFNINLIVNKCNGDRGVLKNELKKIEMFLLGNKKLNTENILKLINLIENYSISELVDNCLAKNKKRTTEILSENSFSLDECILITRTFLNKSKRVLYLSEDFQKSQNIDKTILSARPPIFWKDKEIVKKQIKEWDPKQIKKLIYDLSKIELQVKKNNSNPLNIVSNFILEKSS